MSTSVTDRVVALSSTFLPLEQARQALLLPVRLVRAGAVKVATTVRHWEVALEGATGQPVEEHAATPFAEHPRGTEQRAADDARGESLGADDLPVHDWAELSFADAQARISALPTNDLETLLDYERSHGHRLQYTLLLEQRIADQQSA
jgi:hypothetical protein